MKTANSSDQDTVLYHVLPGDSLSKIITNYYGYVSPQQQKSIIGQIQADNPQIANPNVIHPGQVLLIDVPRQYCPAPGRETPLIQADKYSLKPLQGHWQKSTPEQKNFLTSVAPLMLGAGSASMTMIDMNFKTNTPLMEEMVKNYEDYKAGKMTKGQYNYRREKLLRSLQGNLGPTRRLLGDRRPINEVLRISRKKGTVPTAPLTQQTDKMVRLSKIASRGGVVLSVAGLGVACYQIANTDSSQKKNEIFLEALGGFAGGAIYGIGASILLFSTPVGWVAALAIGVGGAAAGYGAGKLVKHAYTASGVQVDLTSGLGINHLCR
jgi:hypothetical protein